MAAKLHELLAVEKTVTGATEKLMTETAEKFKKPDTYFQGSIKTLQMLEDSTANKALEATSRTVKELATTVPMTLQYLFQFWVKSEDVLFQKNKTNQSAKADVEFRGKVLATDVPVDELMGLEFRLEKMRGLIATAPTLDASVKWMKDVNSGEYAWVSAEDDQTVKTEKRAKAVVLYEATDKHPAQVKEISEDVVVGKFINKKFSGAITAVQKADAMALIDELVGEVKRARVRANNIDASTDKIGGVITGLIMDVFK